MEEKALAMERAYRKQVWLFEGLRECLARERENLINLDVKGIWAGLEQKQKILTSIEETAETIQSFDDGLLEMGVAEAPHADPKKRSSFRELNRKVADLREEARLRVRENMAFIQDTLSFFEELFCLIAEGRGQSDRSLSPGE
jgi:hypothetical protein